jgi:hypothetical protein
MAEITIPAPDASGYWHFVYVTTDPFDGRWYGGKRSTKKHPSIDRYLGSGNWIKKHPVKRRLKREILAFFASSADVFAGEAALITWEKVFDDPLCMNLRDGGIGWSVEAARLRSARPEWQENKRATARRLAASPIWHAKLAAGIARRSTNPEYREAHLAAMCQVTADPIWRAANSAGVKKRSETDSWRAAQLVGGLKRSRDPVWQQNNLAARRRRAEAERAAKSFGQGTLPFTWR